ncbi:unnamed protein product [Brassicogethes aeneus]|uniref:C2H2-type domain-containing protein n=1 Tax=Brassicogethes aeneus TaxID=1431903 RepID=A0A9P0ASL2_BRAAE|nr:unnamed protein product [Brassicogethes aeneus]
MAVEKVYPKIEELTSFNAKVVCPEKNCMKIFTTESNLTLHLVKTHKRNELWLIKKEFYCPNITCMYNTKTVFRNIKPLKQHYMKVHMAKTFACESCCKKFVTEQILQSHKEYCGVTFKCCDCEVSYDCYETLKTHCRRKKHGIKDKKNYKFVTMDTVEPLNIGRFKLILPKPVKSTAVNKVMLNQSCQTELLKPKLSSKSIQVQNEKVDIGTQATIRSSSQSSETQTLEVNSKHSLEDYSEPQKRKHIKIQTTAVPYKTSSCNTSFDLSDFEFTINTDPEKFNSSTQTSSAEFGNNYSSSTNTHDSIHTDTSDLLMYSLNENLDSTFFNCHMETQTDLILPNDDLFNYCDYYSNNMHTQTCSDIFNDVVFNDTETQTTINEMFNSVESQTIMSHTKSSNHEDKYVANIETQTDTEFQIKLEEIHS